jgi:putative selenate reductase
MAELTPAPFEELVRRLYGEVSQNQSLFALPKKKWHLPTAGDPDMSVRFHGKPAGNPSGPAAGPQTQMAQNLLLSYAAGGRILELKTVQINDRLTIPRPCIDITNIGFNVEWSQELLVEQSLREYVAGMMLIEIFRGDPVFAEGILLGPSGEAIFDMSVGYDLAGIKSDKIQHFFDQMRDAGPMIEMLRPQIPPELSLARGLQFPTQISSTLTLSTFHGCPADEIERICEFLILERDLDVIVKMNPPMLGKDRLEHLLHDVMGYTDLTVNPAAYTTGLQFDESIQLTKRLTTLARQRGKRFGCKFSNTLEVINHRTFFTPENKVQYLSGQPLHVITMTLADVFRQAVGPDVPISFSAGIDAKNFPLAVASGFVPVTVCSDLLRPGGYGRLPAYLKALGQAMKTTGSANVDEYIQKAFGHGGEVNSAALANTTTVAEKARQDDRYRAPANRAVPKRVGTTLVTFDCLTCDKCVPVCPNAANFLYPTPVVAFEFQDCIVDATGQFRVAPERRRFEIKESMQIANYADFCNECGNCDTFCPEYGGPYIKKPNFFGSLDAWKKGAPRDGFYVGKSNGRAQIVGRIKSKEYQLAHDAASSRYLFAHDSIVLEIAEADHRVIACQNKGIASGERILDLGVFHTLRHLLHGVLDRKFINQINASM